MKAMSPLYSVWRWLKLPIPQILRSQSQSDPNSPRRKKGTSYRPERQRQQRRPMSPYIARLEPVQERKRQPEQVPANCALEGNHSRTPMARNGRTTPLTNVGYRGLSANAANMCVRLTSHSQIM